MSELVRGGQPASLALPLTFSVRIVTRGRVQELILTIRGTKEAIVQGNSVAEGRIVHQGRHVAGVEEEVLFCI